MKKFNFKKWHSLRYNVAIKILLVIAILSSLLLIFLPLGLKNFFLEESYKTIERTQAGQSSNDTEMMPVDPDEVNYFPLLIVGDNLVLPNNYKQINPDFLNQSLNNTISQTESSQRYVYQSGNTTIYYVVKKNPNTALISYVYASYVNYYISTLDHQLLIIILIVVFLSLIVAIVLANSITKPLILISKKIKSIARDNWDDEISVTRKDEIGDIQFALEEMREHLKSQDKTQREMFQNISHDLKTPIMIIEGYTQSIIDGYVEDKELPEFIDSIMEEAKRLEKKVRSLLYINKIEQLSLEKRHFSEVDIDKVLNTVIASFKNSFPNIKFNLEITSQKLLSGTFDEWRVAIENIVDNMTRFAHTQINIHYHDDEIIIFNDGETIDDLTMSKLFEPYGVGTKSNFGLGLAITYKIVIMFGYHIFVRNVSNGVEFIIQKEK